MIPVGWLDPSQDCWDTNMLRRLLDGDLYPHGLKFRHHAGYPNVDGAVILIVPGRYYAQHTDQINLAIQRFVSVLMVVTSDEEGLFDCSNVLHGNIKFYIQTPRAGREYPAGSRFIGVGFPPHFNELPAEPPEKDLDLFLMGQATHKRREECFQAVMFRDGRWGDDLFSSTDGFTKGDPPEAYAANMVRAKVAPAPSGAVSPDSFRFWEALEAHAIPIADTTSPVDGVTDYWERILPGNPFPVLRDYADLAGYVEDQLRDWPANANRIAAWWCQYKRGLARGLQEDLQALGAL